MSAGNVRYAVVNNQSEEVEVVCFGYKLVITLTFHRLTAGMESR